MKPITIPSQYRCSKCKKDIRERAKIPCDCSKIHPGSANKSGRGIYITIRDYNGKQRFSEE